ncbi:MAG: histidinol-phosphate transaminase [Spirochaetales bacterium]|nr:histidinol-phosphate transaminase [Spirochaetales bacterium]
MKDLNRRLNPGILGIKPYEPGKTVYEAGREKGGGEFIKMASNENPFGMSPAALAAVQARAAEAFAYPEATCREARIALAKRIGVDPECIIFGNGGDGLIYACAMSMLAEGDEAVIPEVTFPYYEIAVRAMRGKAVFSRMEGLNIDLQDILARITKRTKMIWIANPNNPTGAAIGRAAFHSFAARVPEDVFLIYDEVYGDFADASAVPDALSYIRNGRDNVFVIRSFSKIYGLAGVRIGYGVGATALVSMMYRVRPPFDVSVLAQIAALAAIEDDVFYHKTIEHNEREKRFLYAELDRRSLPYQPTSANFILIDAGRENRFLADALLDRGVIVRALPQPSMRTRIRVTIGTRTANEKFLAALDEVLAATGKGETAS